MSKTVVMYITTRVVIQCEDLSLTEGEIFQELDYNFEVPHAGADVVDTELVDYALNY